MQGKQIVITRDSAAMFKIVVMSEKGVLEEFRHEYAGVAHEITKRMIELQIVSGLKSGS